jgi:hypothetical protein
MNINKLLHGPNVAGQSLVDRVMAAKHSLTGEGLAKSVCKATTEEIIPPKKKHIDYLLQCTHEPNVSVPQLAGLLLERTQNNTWVVVYKALISTHTLMNYGNERFMQYLASNNCSFNLDAFMDKTSAQGYDMSPYVRRYAKYLNAKAFSYRQMAYDFCKIKKGKDDGVLRIMEIDKLLKTLPILQGQVDALLEFDVTKAELNNGVINACFMMLFKDLIRLLACYNDGIINLLAKFFEMNRKQCKEALDIYKKFVSGMEVVAKFLAVAESVGIDKGDIPDLAKAPSSLLEALETHLKSLESSKKGARSSAAVTAAISDMTSAAAAAAAAHNGTGSDGDEQNIFFDDSSTVISSNNPFADVMQAADENLGVVEPETTFDLFDPIAAAAADLKPAGHCADLLDLADAFGCSATEGGANNPFLAAAGDVSTEPIKQDDPWSTHGGGDSPSHGTSFATDDHFAAAFGAETLDGQTAGDRSTSPSLSQAKPNHSADDKFVQGNLDATLAKLADNLNIKTSPSHNTKQSDRSRSPTNVTSSSPVPPAVTAPSPMTANNEDGGTQPDDDNDLFADLR